MELQFSFESSINLFSNQNFTLFVEKNGTTLLTFSILSDNHEAPQLRLELSDRPFQGFALKVKINRACYISIVLSDGSSPRKNLDFNRFDIFIFTRRTIPVSYLLAYIGIEWRLLNISPLLYKSTVIYFIAIHHRCSLFMSTCKEFFSVAGDI